MSLIMTPAWFIRTQILNMRQRELGDRLGVSQPMVAKWEKDGGRVPDHHRGTIKMLALERGQIVEDVDFDKVRTRRRTKRRV